MVQMEKWAAVTTLSSFEMKKSTFPCKISKILAVIEDLKRQTLQVGCILSSLSNGKEMAGESVRRVTN